MAYVGVKILLIIVGLVLSFGGGYYVNKNIADSSLQNLQKTNLELIESLEKIKKDLSEVKSKADEIRSFEGTVISVRENIVTLEIAPSLSPLVEWPVMREVMITTGTKILHRGVKSSKATSPFFEEEISIEDIKPGWTITVEAGEDIRAKASFEASRILNDWPFSGLPPILPVMASVSAGGVPVTIPPTGDLPLPANSPKPATPRPVPLPVPAAPSLPPLPNTMPTPPTLPTPPVGVPPGSLPAQTPPPAGSYPTPTPVSPSGQNPLPTPPAFQPAV